MYKKIALASAMLIALTGCSATQNNAQENSCVNVIVDYSSLSSDKFSKCIDTTGNVNALDLVTSNGLNITGTDKYGTQIVCRVNDLPSAIKPINLVDHKDYVESCADMPPEFAYWALLVKTPDGKWDWAQSGIADLTLEPGSSLALVFSENGDVKFPND